MKAWYLLLYHILNFLAINFFNIPAAPASKQGQQGRAGHSLRLPKFKAADIRTSGHPDIRTSGHPQEKDSFT